MIKYTSLDNIMSPLFRVSSVWRLYVHYILRNCCRT